MGRPYLGLVGDRWPGKIRHVPAAKWCSRQKSDSDIRPGIAVRPPTAARVSSSEASIHDEKMDVVKMGSTSLHQWHFLLFSGCCSSGYAKNRRAIDRANKRQHRMRCLSSTVPVHRGWHAKILGGAMFVHEYGAFHWWRFHLLTGSNGYYYYFITTAIIITTTTTTIIAVATTIAITSTITITTMIQVSCCW